MKVVKAPQYRRVFFRALNETRRIVLAHSWKTLGWKILVAAVAFGVVWGLYLFLPAHDPNLIYDKATTGLVVLLTIAILVIGVFLVQLCFVAPFQLWQQEWSRADEAESRCKALTGSGPVRDRTTLLDACAYMIMRRWENPENVFEVMDYITILTDKFHELQQDASDGAVTIWGQSSEWSPRQLRIPATEWASMRVEWFSFTKGNARTEGGPSVWYNLQVSKAEIERVYG